MASHFPGTKVDDKKYDLLLNPEEMLFTTKQKALKGYGECNIKSKENRLIFNETHEIR
jgi:hypothetical protein